MRIFLILFVILLGFYSCVQKTHRRTIVIHLTVDSTNVQTVGVRGRDKPLNWDNDYLLRWDQTTGEYTGVVTTNTGCLFTEIKFTVNGKFESNVENRRLNFSGDTLIYRAKFNRANK